MNHVIRTRASPLKVLYCRQSEANGSAEPCRTCRQLQSTLLSPASSTGPRKYSLQCIPCMHQVLQCSGRPFYLSVRHPNDGIRKDGTRTTARHMLVLPPWSFPEWTFFSPSRNSHLTFQDHMRQMPTFRVASRNPHLPASSGTYIFLFLGRQGPFLLPTLAAAIMESTCEVLRYIKPHCTKY
jgi:hypothetical protein